MNNYTSISETVEAFDEWLNEIYPATEVCGGTFYPADILKEVDPIAYRSHWLDWCDADGIDTDELEDDYTFERDRM